MTTEIENTAVLPIRFTRTIEHKDLHLEEELKLETLNEIEMFYYRSRWNNLRWTQWGYWSQFPKGTSAADVVMFLSKAGWKMESVTQAAS